MFKQAILLGALTGAAALAIKVLHDRAYIVGYSDGAADGFRAAMDDDVPNDGYFGTGEE